MSHWILNENYRTMVHKPKKTFFSIIMVFWKVEAQDTKINLHSRPFSVIWLGTLENTWTSSVVHQFFKNLLIHISFFQSMSTFSNYWFFIGLSISCYNYIFIIQSHNLEHKKFDKFNQGKLQFLMQVQMVNYSCSFFSTTR